MKDNKIEITILEKDKNEKIQEMKRIIDEIEKVPIDELIQEKELGTYNFKEQKPVFEYIKNIFEDIKNLSYKDIPLKKLEELSTAANDCRKLFKTVTDFRINYTEEQRRIKGDEILSFEKRLFDLVIPILVHLSGAEVLRRVNLAYKRIQSRYDEARECVVEIKKIKESSQIAAREMGVTTQANYFERQAKEHRRGSRIWLFLTGLFSAFLIGFGVLIWINVKKMILENYNTTQLIQISIAKLIIFTVLYYAVIWAGKAYKSHKHNYIVNKHRENALLTFRAFIESTDNPEIKNAVLLKATETIFSPQLSGFISSEKDESSNLKVLEIFKNVIGGSK
ncbi:MAG: hypothetical protein JXB26_03015 [Candidatus Aminicenantes bacterium]|nr:hypothetical protein [Candidatus Aminicenantes bacterium]